MDLAGILLIFTTLLLFGLFSRGSWQSATNEKEQSQAKRWIGFYGIWLILVFLTGYFGLVTDFTGMPPKFAIFIILTTVSAVLLAFSPVATNMLMRIPIAWIIGMQGMRVLAELAIWDANRHGLAPTQMSFHGYNFDIITGVVSLLLIPVLLRNRSRSLIIAWSGLGLVLLATVVTIAFLSTPTPLRMFMNEPANTWVTRLPYIFLPGSLVHAALAGHIMVLRWLLEKKFAHNSADELPVSSLVDQQV